MDNTGRNITFFVVGVTTLALMSSRFKKWMYDMSLVRSIHDGEEYLVRNLPDKQAAADRLATVRSNILRLMNALRQTHKEHHIAKAILANFDAAPIRFSESAPDSSQTSYTLNKGEKVYMCLRQRNEKEELVGINVLTFVALHELAHIGTHEIGHTPIFWNNFAWILEYAEKVGVYEYQDFAAHPVEYCGVQITDQPKYKESLNKTE